MANSGNRHDLRAILRRRLSRLLSKSTGEYTGLHKVADAISSRQWRAFVFGGVARDLLASPSSPTFRDVDLVFVDVPTDALISAFQGYIRRTTRFGGLHLNVAGWKFDVWPLEETWAFKGHSFDSIGPRFLPHTTFLNIEAVAIDFLTERGRARQIYESHFFAGFRDRVVDINFEQNPYPQLCVVRSMVAAARLRFSISRRLATYIAEHSEGVLLKEFEDVQRQHYGHLVINRDELIKWLEVVKAAAADNHCSSVELPIPVWRQLELWQHPG